MMEIGRRIYYERNSGNVIQDTNERQGHVRETTIEEDFQTYRALAERVPETVGHVQLEYGQYAEDFATCTSYRINPETQEIEFSYPDGDEEPKKPVYQKPLTTKVDELEQENTTLKLALAELSEAQEQDKTEVQLALAELAELVGGESIG